MEALKVESERLGSMVESWTGILLRRKRPFATITRPVS